MRDFDTAILNKLDEDQLAMSILCELDFVGGKQYIWYGPEGVALEWDGNTYTSLADLGEIDKITEAQGMMDARSVVSLRLNSDNVSGPIGSDDSRGREADLLLLVLADDGEPIGEIRHLFTMGRLSVSASVRTDGPGRLVDEKLSLELLNATAILPQTNYMRMTYEAGLRIDSGDHFLEHAADPGAARALGGLDDGRVINFPDPTPFYRNPQDFHGNWHYH